MRNDGVVVSMGIYGWHGHLWVSMDVYGFLGVYGYLGVYGCLWVLVFMGIYGFLWVFMDFRVSMGIRESLWMFMGIYKCLWMSWVPWVYGFLWVCFSVYGCLWMPGTRLKLRMKNNKKGFNFSFLRDHSKFI